MMSKLMMVAFVGGLIFIAVGDTFLPKPMSQWSYQARNTINTALVKSFHPKVKKPSQKRENQVQQLEEQVNSAGENEKK